jgi:hypothetical protein
MHTLRSPLAALMLVVAVLVPAGVAVAAARTANATEKRAVRAALSNSCTTTSKFSQVAISRTDPRYALFNFDDRKKATTLCVAIVRRDSRTAKMWKVRLFRRGLSTFDVAIKPCPKELPRDLRGTVQPTGANDPLVVCGN